MTWLQPSVRSFPFREARSPSRIAMWPLVPVACAAMNLHEFRPYFTLSARTIMKTLPELGATSTLTTGMFLLAAKSSAGAIAALSTGLTISAWAPSWISVWMSVICLAASLLATSGPISVALYWLETFFAEEKLWLHKTALFQVHARPNLQVAA